MKHKNTKTAMAVADMVGEPIDGWIMKQTKKEGFIVLDLWSCCFCSFEEWTPGGPSYAHTRDHAVDALAERYAETGRLGQQSIESFKLALNDLLAYA